MHPNSMQAHCEEGVKLSKRSAHILEFVRNQSHPLTDRQTMERLGFCEPNAVRPRITELIKAGMLQEAGKIKCPVTNKSVRLVSVFVGEPGQMEML
jgi:hypothetical protein